MVYSMKITKINQFFKNLHSLKKRTLFSGIIAILGTIFIIAAQPKVSNISINAPEQSQYDTIVFDLGDVLLTTSSSLQRSLFLPTIAKNPSLLYHLIGTDIKSLYFDVLTEIPATSIYPVYNKGMAMPLIMTDWMTGSKSLTKLRLMAHQQIQLCTHPMALKQLFIQISQFMFNDEMLAQSQIKIEPMVALAKKLKQHGYKIYILSNWDPYSFDLIKQKYSDIFDITDGMIISGHEQVAKPDKAIFDKLLVKYSLNPKTCIFIDDEKYNIETAQAMGFTTILHVNPILTSKDLIKCGIMRLTA